MLTIAIDGPSAAGKTTVAKALAKKYNMVHLDTGSMYRTLAYALVQQQKNVRDEAEIVHFMDKIQMQFYADGSIVLDGKPITDEIRTTTIAKLASDISKFQGVRTKLVAMQQALSSKGGYILDGRDIGSVVLPNAEVKLYLDADPLIRSKRRYDELSNKGNENLDFDELHKGMVIRDTQDASREHSPLVCVEDAYYIDNSNLTIEEEIQVISEYIETKIS